MRLIQKKEEKKRKKKDESSLKADDINSRNESLVCGGLSEQAA